MIESPPPFAPLSLTIRPNEGYRGGMLDAIARIDPCADGGVDEVTIDQHPIERADATASLLASGYEEVHAVDEGLCVHFMDGVVGHDWRLTARNLHNCLRLRIPFTGVADFEAPEVRVSDLDSRCTFIVQPAGTRIMSVYRAGVAYRYCMLNLSQRFLTERLGLRPDDLPRPMMAAWNSGETTLGHVTLSRFALAGAMRFFSLQREGNLRRVEVHALALDVLLQFLSCWTEPSMQARTRIKLRPSEREQLAKLRTIADERSPSSVSIAEAVALTGLNKNKIHLGFQQFYGMSLREYCFDRRMRHARTMLLDSSIPIAMIAESVGFSEPTNFSHAFKKFFGTLPSWLRASSDGPAGELHQVRSITKP